jgi:hypothetical protein
MRRGDVAVVRDVAHSEVRRSGQQADDCRRVARNRRGAFSGEARKERQVVRHILASRKEAPRLPMGLGGLATKIVAGSGVFRPNKRG